MSKKIKVGRAVLQGTLDLLNSMLPLAANTPFDCAPLLNRILELQGLLAPGPEQPAGDLLLCPFCGGPAKLTDRRLLWSVHCEKCTACVLGGRAPEPHGDGVSDDAVQDAQARKMSDATDWNHYEQSAVDAWNSRASAIPCTHPPGCTSCSWCGFKAAPDPIALFETVLGKNPTAYLHEPVYQVTESEVRDFAQLLTQPTEPGATG